MANIDNFVQVTVTKESASVTQQGFGTPLGLFQVPTSIIASRYAIYSSPAEMVTAGFATTDPAYVWASAVLGQEFSPRFAAIGRRGEGTAQVDTVTITTADAGTWTLTIDSVVISYVATVSDTEITIAEGLRAAIVAHNADVNSLTGLAVTVPVDVIEVATFDVTAWVAGEPFVNGGIVAPGGGAGTFANSVANGVAEDITAALNAVQVENDDWYGLNVESRQNTDILAANTWVASQMKIFVSSNNDQTALTNTAGNLGELLGATSNKRTQYFWHDKPAKFADGAMLGRALAFKLDDANGAGTWALKQLQVINRSKLNSTQQVNLKAANADFMTEAGGRNTTNTGKSVEGEFMDIQTTLDWTASRVQEDVFAAKATSPTKIPYTNEGISIIKTAVLGVLFRGVTNAHFSPDDPTLPKVTAPNSLTVPAADKNARILRNVIGEAIISGAIHDTRVQVNVLA